MEARNIEIIALFPQFEFPARFHKCPGGEFSYWVQKYMVELQKNPLACKSES